MSEQQAAYMIEALADGKHMTEASMTEMDQFIADAHARGDTIRATILPEPDYIETLERAVLAGWYPLFDNAGDKICPTCDYDSDIEPVHAPGCIIPALIAKYADDSD